MRNPESPFNRIRVRNALSVFFPYFTSSATKALGFTSATRFGFCYRKRFSANPT